MSARAPIRPDEAPTWSVTPKSSRADFTIDQNWEAYSEAEHDVWRRLYRRQCAILPGRVVPEFLDGLEALHMDEIHIPNFDVLNEKLRRSPDGQS